MEQESKVQPPPREGLPKLGKVHEVRREWLVREDGALAYQLQSQEFNQHLQHNKHKNAQVREDFPCALDEQLREQRLAEQAAAVYHKMLQEQEEIDNQIARELAEKLEKEDRVKRRQLEKKEEHVPKLTVKDGANAKRQLPPPKLPEKSPHRPDKTNYFANLPSNSPRKALQMPLPNELRPEVRDEYMTPEDCIELYTEPYDNSKSTVQQDRQSVISNHFERLDLQEIGVPIDEITERRIQEERDAELARQLQEQEGAAEEILLNRDRMLAIEARDKELAKMLQERERAKVKRARERAKQKAQAKKQMEEQQKLDANQLLPDDSYAFPADLIPHRGPSFPAPTFLQKPVPDDDSYSNPLDVLHQEVRYSPQKSYDGRYQNGAKSYKYNDKVLSDEVPPPTRPTQLDLRSPLNRISKPRMPDPEPCDPLTNAQGTPSQHVNIAMAIDPTYPRKGAFQSPPSYDTTSSTVTTSTSSSSPGLILPPPELSELEGDSSPVPPYMPIQGQRRTSSLEKKQKKKSKDGCRQQ